MITSLLTFLGSTVLGGALQLISRRQEIYAAQQAALLKLNQLQVDSTEMARRYDSSSVTRQVLAIMMLFSTMVLPKLVMIFCPDILVTITYMQADAGSLFSLGQDAIKFVTVPKGFIVSPLDIEITMSIVGLYFGRSIART